MNGSFNQDFCIDDIDKILTRCEMRFIGNPVLVG